MARPKTGNAAEQISIRVPPDALARAGKLRPKLARDPSVRALGIVSRSTVLKLAMLRGLDVLEQEYK